MCPKLTFRPRYGPCSQDLQLANISGKYEGKSMPGTFFETVAFNRQDRGKAKRGRDGRKAVKIGPNNKENETNRALAGNLSGGTTPNFVSPIGQAIRPSEYCVVASV